jgi:hypothetical protein
MLLLLLLLVMVILCILLAAVLLCLAGLLALERVLKPMLGVSVVNAVKGLVAVREAGVALLIAIAAAAAVVVVALRRLSVTLLTEDLDIIVRLDSSGRFLGGAVSMS